MSSHGTAMQEVTKEELNMISSVADIGTDQVNESTFLRRSGRLTKSQAVPVVGTLPLKAQIPEAASTPKPSRRIAAMKTKVMSATPATETLSTAAKTPITTGSTDHEASMADTQKSSKEIATKDTKITKSTGRKSSAKRQNPSISAESTPAVTQQQDSAVHDEARTPPNTDNVDEEVSSAIEDAHDTDFVPDVTSGMHSLPPLGGALPASPPSSNDAPSPSNKRKSDSSNSEDGPSAKRSNSKKTPSKAKPSQGAELTIINKGPLPHGTPLVWAEVILTIFPSCLSLLNSA